MCRIDSQLKKLIRFKYLVLETPYTIFSIFSGYFSFTPLNDLTPFPTFPFLCLCLQL